MKNLIEQERTLEDSCSGDAAGGPVAVRDLQGFYFEKGQWKDGEKGE